MKECCLNCTYFDLKVDSFSGCGVLENAIGRCLVKGTDESILYKCDRYVASTAQQVSINATRKTT